MFICGNDAAAKAEVKTILDQFGWGIEDMAAPRPREPSSALHAVVHPGFRPEPLGHAFKLLE